MGKAFPDIGKNVCKTVNFAEIAGNPLFFTSFEEIDACSRLQKPPPPQDILRVMGIAKKSGLEFLCRPACEYKSSWNQAKAGAREGILR